MCDVYDTSFNSQTRHSVKPEIMKSHRTRYTIAAEACKADTDLWNGLRKAWSLIQKCKEKWEMNGSFVKSMQRSSWNWMPCQLIHSHNAVDVPAVNMSNHGLSHNHFLRVVYTFSNNQHTKSYELQVKVPNSSWGFYTGGKVVTVLLFGLSFQNVMSW